MQVRRILHHRELEFEIRRFPRAEEAGERLDDNPPLEAWCKRVREVAPD